MAPPNSPPATSGTSATRLTRPTWNDERVTAKTCSSTAVAVIWEPRAEIVSPTHNRR